MGIGVVLRRQAVLPRETIEIRHRPAVDDDGVVVVLLGHDEDVPRLRNATARGGGALRLAGDDESERSERQAPLWVLHWRTSLPGSGRTAQSRVDARPFTVNRAA